MGSIKDHATTDQGSAMKRYSMLVVGRPGVGPLLLFELGQVLMVLPGALGIMLRQRVLPLLLGLRARKPTVGFGVSFRHPRRIELGRHVVIDELCSLDGNGEEDITIKIGDRAMLARNTKVSAKGGVVEIGERCGLGANMFISAPVGSSIRIGADCVIGAGTYIGGSNYNISDVERPIAEQGYQEHQGVSIEDGCWLGAHVRVLDGVTIGRGAVIGAGAVVTRSIPAFAIARGVPAKVVGDRRELGE